MIFASNVGADSQQVQRLSSYVITNLTQFRDLIAEMKTLGDANNRSVYDALEFLNDKRTASEQGITILEARTGCENKKLAEKRKRDQAQKTAEKRDIEKFPFLAKVS